MVPVYCSLKADWTAVVAPEQHLEVFRHLGLTITVHAAKPCQPPGLDEAVAQIEKLRQELSGREVTQQFVENLKCFKYKQQY